MLQLRLEARDFVIADRRCVNRSPDTADRPAYDERKQQYAAHNDTGNWNQLTHAFYISKCRGERQ